MLWLSHILFGHPKTKRIPIQLLSAAQTGYIYSATKSPLKKNYRMALRKYDPVANAHVLFYESKLPVTKRKWLGRKHFLYTRWTGDVNPARWRDLMGKVERKYEKTGRF